MRNKLILDNQNNIILLPQKDIDKFRFSRKEYEILKANLRTILIERNIQFSDESKVNYWMNALKSRYIIKKRIWKKRHKTTNKRQRKNR